MSITIVKKYTFEAGHRLSLGYVGNCANLHGHSYKVHIEIRGFALDSVGMIVDFNHLKPLKLKIKDTFDHKTLLHSSDSQLIDFLIDLQGRDTVHIMDENPTCEAIAKEIFRMSVQVLKTLFSIDHVPEALTIGDRHFSVAPPHVLSVTVQETETGSAVVTRSGELT